MRRGVVDLDKVDGSDVVRRDVDQVHIHPSYDRAGTVSTPRTRMWLAAARYSGAREVPSAVVSLIAFAAERRNHDGMGKQRLQRQPDGTPLYERRSYALRQVTLTSPTARTRQSETSGVSRIAAMCEDADARRGPCREIRWPVR